MNSSLTGGTDPFRDGASVKARTKAETQRIDAEAKAEARRVEAAAEGERQRLTAEADAAAERIRTTAEMDARSRPALQRALYIGFDKHVRLDRNGAESDGD